MRACALLLLLWWLPCGSAELEGVRLEDRVHVDGQTLQLNGIALRTRMVLFKVYVAGLYLPQKARSAPAALHAKGAKRVNFVMVRDATADQFVASIHAGLRRNNSEAELARVRPQIDALMAMIRKAGVAKVGSSIVLDYAPSIDGTTLYIDGKPAGPPMATEAFFRILMRIWLGENPAQEDLKRALLGS